MESKIRISETSDVLLRKCIILTSLTSVLVSKLYVSGFSLIHFLQTRMPNTNRICSSTSLVPHSRHMRCCWGSREMPSFRLGVQLMEAMHSGCCAPLAPASPAFSHALFGARAGYLPKSLPCPLANCHHRRGNHPLSCATCSDQIQCTLPVTCPSAKVHWGHPALCASCSPALYYSFAAEHCARWKAHLWCRDGHHDAFQSGLGPMVGHHLPLVAWQQPAPAPWPWL